MCLLHINIYICFVSVTAQDAFLEMDAARLVRFYSNSWLHGEINTHIRWYVFAAYGPAAPSWAWNQQCGKKQPLPFQSILQNTITVALLEVNLLPACSDEVHLIVHTNGPREAHKMIEQLCFGDEYWKLKLVSAYRDLSPISADNYVDAFVQNGKQPICFQVSLMLENDAFWQGMFMFTVKVLALQQLKKGTFHPS